MQTIPAVTDTPSQPKNNPPSAGPEMLPIWCVEAIQAEPRDKFSLPMMRGTIENIAGCEKARAAPVRNEDRKSATI